MSYSAKLILTLLSALFISACARNNVTGIAPNTQLKPSEKNSIVVLGVRGIDRPESFGALLVEYDVMNQKNSGDCWVYNNINVSAKRNPSEVVYYVFSVPPGFYAEMGVPADQSTAYFVPKNSYVYLGDFSFDMSKTKAQILRGREQNIASALSFLKSNFSSFSGDLKNAQTLNVAQPYGFLCSP